MWNRSSAPRSPRVPGITLLEMLIALAILSLVLTLAYGSFFQVSGAATALKTELDEQQELRLILKMIADDLQASRCLTNLPSKAGVKPLSGIVAKVRFVGKSEFSYVDFHAATESRFFRQRPPEL